MPGTISSPCRACIVVAVKRRTPLALIAVVAASLTGCSTFTDNDAAARVGDVEYSHDDVVADLEALGATPEQLATADIARGQVASWIAGQVAESADPSLAEDAYAKGLFESGSICLDVLATASQADADAVVADLEAGTSFDDAFAASNTDPALSDTGGHIGCLALAELAIGVGNPLVDSITTINAADPLTTAVLPGATADTDLYIVSRFVPYEELGPDETPIVAASLPVDALDLDIYVDPQIGTYDSASGTVIPLG